MSITLSKGYILPVKGEKGTWWKNITDNFTRVNNHTHDGIDSQFIPLYNLQRTVQLISSAGWVASGFTTPFKQVITIPSPITFDTTNIIFKLTSTGETIYPKVDKLTANTLEVFVNDNTLNLTIVYA